MASQYLAPVIAYRFADFVVWLLSDAHLLLCGDSFEVYLMAWDLHVREAKANLNRSGIVVVSYIKFANISQ